MKRKKVLSMLLALAMVLTMSSTGVFAAEEMPAMSEPDAVAAEETTEADSEEATAVTEAAESEEATEAAEVTEEETAESEEAAAETVERVGISADINFAAKAGNGEVTLTWNKVEGLAAEDYKISVDGNEADIVPTVGLKLAKAVVTGLENNVEHIFELKYDFDGESYSAEASATPVYPLNKISTIKTQSGYKSVKVLWKPATTDPVAHKTITYVVERYVENSSGKKVLNKTYTFDQSGKNRTAAQLKSDLLTFNNGGLKLEKTYYYKVYVKGRKSETVSAVVGDQAVRQAYIKITVKTTKTLSSHAGPKRSITVHAGDVIYTDGYGSGKYHFHKNGSLYYLMRVSTKNAKGIYTTSWDYSPAEAENFVNQKGIKSGTNYAVWVSEYCQHLYIFKKTDGKWKCIKNWKISTGKPSTPSPTGMKKIIKKISYRHHIPYWSCYSSLNALHAVRYQSWADKLGTMQSGGCIRNKNDNAKYIYNYLKNGTRVYVY